MKRLMLLSLGMLCIGCAAGNISSAESALDSLDSGDYAAAVTALEALDSTTINEDYELTLSLASAYAGRAGVDFLDLAQELLEDTNSDQAFSVVHGAFVSTIGTDGLADLLLAIQTLDNFSGTAPTAGDTAELRYRLGLLQAIDAFARGTITAKPAANGDTTVTDITSKDQVQLDFINADNNLTNDGEAGGLASDNQLVEVVRDSYCALKNISAGDGFTLAEFQDLTACQLADDAETLTAADFQSDDITNCGDFEFSCTGADQDDTTL